MNYKIKDFWAGIHFVWSSIKWVVALPVIAYIVMIIAAVALDSHGVETETVIRTIFYPTIIIMSLIAILIPVIYWVNSTPLEIKNNKICIPAADIENGFFDLLTLKRVRGLYYTVCKPISELVDVKYDFGRDPWNLQPYHGNSRNKQWKLNISFEDGTNYQIYFSNKQKRDAAVGILRKIRNNTRKASFGPDIAF